MLSCQITKQACLTPALFLELARGGEVAASSFLSPLHLVSKIIKIADFLPLHRLVM